MCKRVGSPGENFGFMNQALGEDREGMEYLGFRVEKAQNI